MLRTKIEEELAVLNNGTLLCDYLDIPDNQTSLGQFYKHLKNEQKYPEENLVNI